jgi:hypothetical protein
MSFTKYPIVRELPTYNATLHNLAKHSKKFPCIFGAYLISMNIPPTKEEGSYTYSLRVGEKLCLSIGLRSH